MKEINTEVLRQALVAAGAILDECPHTHYTLVVTQADEGATGVSMQIGSSMLSPIMIAYTLRKAAETSAMELVHDKAIIARRGEPLTSAPKLEPEVRGHDLTCHRCRKQYPPGWRKDCEQCGAPHEEIYL